VSKALSQTTTFFFVFGAFTGTSAPLRSALPRGTDALRLLDLRLRNNTTYLAYARHSLTQTRCCLVCVLMCRGAAEQAPTRGTGSRAARAVTSFWFIKPATTTNATHVSKALSNATTCCVTGASAAPRSALPRGADALRLLDLRLRNNTTYLAYARPSLTQTRCCLVCVLMCRGAAEQAPTRGTGSRAARAVTSFWFTEPATNTHATHVSKALSNATTCCVVGVFTDAPAAPRRYHYSIERATATNATHVSKADYVFCFWCLHRCPRGSPFGSSPRHRCASAT